MNKIILALSIACICILIGCATQTAAPRETPATTQIYFAPKDVVWPLIVAKIGLNYPVRAVEKDSGLLTTDFVLMPAGYNNARMGEWVIPPHSLLATWNGLRMSMSVLVTELEPSKTQVTIRTHYEAFENNVTKSWIVCESSGQLERGILSQLLAKHDQELSLKALRMWTNGIPSAGEAKP